MPLCGLRKSKKEKRDPSPPFTRKENSRQIEDVQLAEANKIREEAEKQLATEKRERQNAEKKINDLQKQLEEAKKKKDAKAEDKADGLGMSMLASSVRDEKEELQRKVEEEAQQREAAVKERLNFEEKTKETVKVLETAKSEAEEAKQHIEDELKTAQKTLETERSQRLKTEEEKEKMKREKDAIENTLAHTKKELEIAKKESHIPRSPTKIPSEEWKAQIETAQSEFQKEREAKMEKEKELARMISEKEQLILEKLNAEEQVKVLQQSREAVSSDVKHKLENTEMNYKNDLNKLEETIGELKNSLKQKESDNESLLDRLSAVTAAQVLDNNPNVADLSDPNRPQKLSEQMGQLYDDEWTDASEALESLNYNDDDIPKTLTKILNSVYNHCKESSENQLSRIEEDIFLPPLENPPTSPENGTELLKSPTSSKSHSMSKIPRFTSHKGRPALPNLSTEKKTVDVVTNGKEKDKAKRSLSFPRVKGEKFPELPVEIKKGIKDYRKKVTKQVIPVIEREVTNKLRNDPDIGDKVVDACKSYISRCLELCWLMCVQDPPVALSWKVPDDNSFAEDIFRSYTQNGSQIDYVVWPAVYLYDGGPMLTKGVAQGIA